MAKFTTTTIGPRIQQLRHEKGLSAVAMSKASGVSRGFYRKLETGERIPSIQRLIKISEALGCSPCDLMREGE